MADAVGGSIEAISIAGREFVCPADAEANRSLGGFTADVEANGNGSARIVLTRTTWMLDGLAVEINDSNGDQEFLQDVVDSAAFVDVTISYVNQESYTGVGMLTGDMNHASKNTTMPISLKGRGKLTKQS